MSAPEFIIVGRLRKAHGVRGDLVVEPITDAPAEVFSAGRRVFAGTAEGDLAPERRTLTVERARAIGNGAWLVGFAEIGDRNAADTWRGRYVLLPATELRAPAADEVYVHELSGMSLELPDGTPLGEVADVFELPHGFILDVRWRGRSVMLPYAADYVVGIDREARRLVVQPPEGLFE